MCHVLLSAVFFNQSFNCGSEVDMQEWENHIDSSCVKKDINDDVSLCGEGPMIEAIVPYFFGGKTEIIVSWTVRFIYPSVR